MTTINQIRVTRITKDQTDYLIHEVGTLENFLSKMIQATSKKELNQFGKSQIRHLLSAVKNATGVKELSLFIEYQMSRDTNGNTWSFTSGNSVLGLRIIEIMNRIESKVKEIVEDSKASGSEPISEAEKHEILIRMLERFFLYWAWKYQYLITIVRKDSSSNDQENSRNNINKSKKNYR